MKRAFAVFIGLVAALACTAPALADEGTSAPLCAPPTCFVMADGQYFYPGQTDAAVVDASATPIAPAVTQDASATPSSPVDQPVTFSLKQAIIRGRAMLVQKLADDAAAHPKAKTVPSLNSWVDVTLAVWNAKTDEIKLVTVQKAGAKVKLGPDDDAAFDVSVRSTNGVNSQFAVATVDPQDDSKVVAVEYPIFTEKRITRKKKVYQLNDVVYTPYSQELRASEVVDWGKTTLDGYLADVYSALRQAGVMSRAFPGKPLADVIDPDIVRDIVMIEHLGPNAVLKGDAGAATESVYVTLAANQADAYAYAKSTAGALGMVQFIPSTYRLLTGRQDLGLIKDFTTGMRDPRNAIKATVGYLDAELASMPLAVRDLYSVDPARVGEYLAAAYNGGGARVHKAIASFGDGWSDGGTARIEEMRAERAQNKQTIASLTAKAKKADAKSLRSIKSQLASAKAEDGRWVDRIEAAKKAVLRPETVDYVKKYRVVMQLLKPPPAVTLAAAL